MPHTVKYVTKVREISEVVLRGLLDYSDGWVVAADDLDEWLEKFKGKQVALTITTFDRDESHLLPEADR